MRRPRASEFAWIAIPALALGVTLALTWRAQRSEPRPNEPAHVHPEAS